MFFCEFCEISENTFFTDHFRVTASGKRNLVCSTAYKSSANVKRWYEVSKQET